VTGSAVGAGVDVVYVGGHDLVCTKAYRCTINEMSKISIRL